MAGGVWTGRRPGDKAVSLLASTGVRIDLMLQVVMTIIFYYIHILVLVARIQVKLPEMMSITAMCSLKTLPRNLLLTSL